MANPSPTLDQLLSVYGIQTSLMQFLNHYDFRNLRLAGTRVPATSGSIQRKHLVQIRCNEYGDLFDNNSRCGNHPHNVEMRPCEGLSSILRPGDPKVDFEDPQLGHLHDGSDESASFWVCVHCRNRNNARHRDPGPLLDSSYVRLCKKHSLQHEGSPSNACRCGIAATGDWKCTLCIVTGLNLLRIRARHACSSTPLHFTLFGVRAAIVRPEKKWTWWVVDRLEQALQAQTFVNRHMSRVLSTFGMRPREPQMIKWSELCSVEGCKQPEWKDIRAMRMCLVCQTIFPPRNPFP